MSSALTAFSVRDLSVSYRAGGEKVSAVRNVSLGLGANEWVGLVGESGSGKTSVALAVMRLIKPPGEVEHGSVSFRSADGSAIDFLTLPEGEARRLRLSHLAFVPQGSMNALNPVLRIREQMEDGFIDHGIRLRREALDLKLIALLRSVGLAPSVMQMYPHQLSGGMKQRVCIAIAVSLNPRIIIADEPTSALDVVVQKQVIEKLKSLQKSLRACVLLVSHDMALMAQTVDRIAVMYRGKIVEIASVWDLFSKPLHPYTRHLIRSVPKLSGEPTQISQATEAPSFESAPSTETELVEAEPRHFVASVGRTSVTL